MGKNILTINGGSSSIKFALYASDNSFARLLSGKIENIGLPNAVLSFINTESKNETREIPGIDFKEAVEVLKKILGEHVDFNDVAAVGHRVVQGMNHKEYTFITGELIKELKDLSSLDPEHLPFEIAIIEMLTQWQSGLKQVACFDTVFHHDMPRVAQMLAIPRRFEKQGVRRYGFHGLSCSYVMEQLEALDPEKAKGNVIIAHLGNGASITAVQNGKSFDTSMGFTPAGGILMSSRIGDVDPGVLLYMMKSEGLSVDSLNSIVNHESGLLGISETSSSMLELLIHEKTDERAREAIELFCYEVKKRIGAYVAALGGVDTVIFTGGIGEGASRVRTSICSGLQFLGIALDEVKNSDNAEIISMSTAPVSVRVIHTNEELVIASITRGMIAE